MPYPHTFEFLRDGDRPAVLMCGAGASSGLNPLPQQILAANRDHAEQEIAAISCREFPALAVSADAPDALYVWAEQAQRELIFANHPCPKLKIAQVLKLTSDPKWLAGVTIPIAFTLPRHRVVARLAREGRWKSIWTFNWDCRIEASLESIGLKAEEDVPNQPWLMRYHRVLALRDYGNLPQNRTINIHKRHGCIWNLKNLDELEASGKATANDYNELRFLITKAELNEVLDKESADYLSFRGQIVSEFSGNPLTVWAWSASEKYLLDEFESSAAQLRTFPNPVGRLSIVDPKFSGEGMGKGHERLVGIYAVTKNQAHFPIAPAAGVPDQDVFFLWLQTLYALSIMHRTLGDHKALQDWFVAVFERVKADPLPSWITYWADAFLPAWVQLCWRAFLVTASYQGAKMKPEDIKLERDGWYVPLALDLPDRPEIIAAAYLLKALDDAGKSFQFDLVPGALYQDSTAEFLIPLPTWGEPTEMNSLNSVKRIADGIQAKRGFAKKVTLLGINRDGTEVSDEKKKAVKDAYFQVARLPADASIELVGLSAI